MGKQNQPDDIEKLLDAMDKFKAGDQNAFEGMTFNLDSDDKSKCLEEDK